MDAFGQYRLRQYQLGQVLALADIRSINDLDEETMGYLTFELEGRVPITQFQVSVEEFYAWRASHPNVPDIEYDANTNHVVIKATTTRLHETVILIFDDWLQKWGDEINEIEEREEYHCKLFSSAALGGRHLGSERQADVGLWKVGAQRPSLVVEVGVNEPLREEGRRWFEGTDNGVTSAILVNVIEEDRPGPVPEHRTWGLSASELLTIDHLSLTEHISNWHRRNNVPLMGNRFSFELTSMRPGGRISDAVVKMKVPLPWQLPPRPSMQPFTVSLSDWSNYDPESPMASLNLRYLALELGKCAADFLPLQRANKMAWAFIARREMGMR